MIAQTLLQYYLLGIPVFLMCRMLHIIWHNGKNLATLPQADIHWLAAETACERALISALMWPAGLILTPLLITATYLVKVLINGYKGATKSK